jgi:hypothetical protein
VDAEAVWLFRQLAEQIPEVWETQEAIKMVFGMQGETSVAMTNGGYLGSGRKSKTRCWLSVDGGWKRTDPPLLLRGLLNRRQGVERRRAKRQLGIAAGVERQEGGRWGFKGKLNGSWPRLRGGRRPG